MAEEIVTKLTAALFKALGHPVRVKILQILKDGELCVCDLIDAIHIEQSNLSQHLSVLKKQGLIDCRKDGQKMMYWIAYPTVLQLLEAADQTLQEQLGHSQGVLKFMQVK